MKDGVRVSFFRDDKPSKCDEFRTLHDFKYLQFLNTSKINLHNKSDFYVVYQLKIFWLRHSVLTLDINVSIYSMNEEKNINQLNTRHAMTNLFLIVSNWYDNEFNVSTHRKLKKFDLWFENSFLKFCSVLHFSSLKRQASSFFLVLYVDFIIDLNE